MKTFLSALLAGFIAVSATFGLIFVVTQSSHSEVVVEALK